MANIRSLSDLKKQGGGGGGGGGRGGPPGGDFPGGGFPGGFPGMFGGGPAPNEKNIKRLKAENALQQELRSAGGKLVIAYFTASWCGPCKHIAPIYAELSNKYTEVVFLKIDVDELQETARNNNIQSIPAFHFFKNGSKVAEVVGADPDQLKATIEKHKASSGGGNSNFSSGGYVLGRGSSTTPSAEPTVTQPTAIPPPSTTTPTAPTQGSSTKSFGGDVNEIFLLNLVEMGFPREKAEKAVIATKGSSLEAAMEWCWSHGEDEQGQALGGTPKNAPSPMETESTAPTEESTVQTTTTTQESDEPTVHNAICNGCMKKIVGIRWKCAMCSDYDLCSDCYPNRTHNLEHLFDAYEKDIENPERKLLTPEELEERKRQLQEKIKERKQMKVLEEKQADVDREKNRIKNGKEAQEAKKLWEQKTKDREEALARKEKEEAKKAKALIKAKIEQDRLEREAAKKKATEEGTVQTMTLEKPIETVVAPPSKKEYNESLIQIRFKDGNTIKATFKPTDPVRTVFDHVALLLHSQNFSLATNFPRKVYSNKDSNLDTTTLQQAELVPTGTFIVQ